MTPRIHAFFRRLREAGALGAILASTLCGNAFATSTLADAPLFTSSMTAVKPNIMFVLDDSGSMAWDFLPDAAGNFESRDYGKWASQCNGLAYNHDASYDVPVDATGTSLGNAVISDWISPNPTTQLDTVRSLGGSVSVPTVGSKARINLPSGNYNLDETLTVYRDANNYYTGKLGQDSNGPYILVAIVKNVSGASTWSATGGVWLGIGEPVSGTYYNYTGAEPRLNFLYNSKGVAQSNNFYTECSALSSSSGKFTAVSVTSSSTEAQNYANWAKYYRTRIGSMRSATSIAFKGVDSRYRVGYSTISQTKAIEGANFLDIRDFDGTQKANFYSKFNSAQPLSSTPLRGALARAGQYFAKKAPSQTSDPMQYACQRNFTILSTDGMWNDTADKTYPPGLDGNHVDQQDDKIPRPMLDGTSVTVTTTDSWTSTTVTTATSIFPRVVTNSSVTNSTSTSTVTQVVSTSYSMPNKSVSASSMSLAGCSSGYCSRVVVTLSNHGLSTGDVVTISGGSDSAYDATSVSVTRIDSSHFQYNATNWIKSNNSANGTYIVGDPRATSCGASGVWKSVDAQNQTTTLTTGTVTTSTSLYTVTQVTTSTQTQPFSYVVQEVNGVVQAGQLNPGTLTTSSPTVTSTQVLSSTQTSTVSLQPTTTTATGSSTNQSGGCVASAGTNSSSSSVLSTTPPTANAPVQNNSVPPQDGQGQTTTSKVTSDSAHVTTTSTSSQGGMGDTLADVASYYYLTDLRDTKWNNCTGALGTDVCANKVPGQTADAYHSFGDAASWQHMTTFTLGLGVSGTLKYDPNYLTARSGDFFKIVNRQLNWPNPVANEPTTVDDLWHAAVDGHGQYFSAGDPQALTQGLNSALAQIQAITGAASAASTSSLQPVQGDNDIYVAQFTTQEWIGDVLAYKIDPTTGNISSTPTWSAKAQLGLQTPSARTIYYKQPGANTIRAFTYSNLTTDSLNGLFDNFCNKSSSGGGVAPDQCATLNPTDLASANSGSNLVNYLRGDQTMNNLYRSRTAVLGDVMNASPLFVGKPGFRYTENNYADFVATKANRTAVVLAAANDGMLHAFDRTTGNELWAYIPSFVLPNLYMLADNGYMSNHHYYVDGSPQIGDIYVNGAWKTIVVGGLNKGGRGYYALDVTDPANPKVLWEFQDNNLGYSYGNPIITKRTDGTWVVVFGSGYENTSPGDGNGHLFVVNANTGAKILTVDTMLPNGNPAGTTTTPSGMAKINSWVDSELVNTSQRFYGGDLLGNLWRFDIDNLVQPNQAALQLAQLKLSNGTLQPITVKPSLALVQYNSVNYPVVYIATGAYLRTTDVSDTTVQSVYAIKDPLTGIGWGDLRGRSDLVVQTITTGTDANGHPTRSTSASGTVNWSTKVGWRVDFPVGGERVSVDPQLALNTLYLGTNLPSADSCTVGGDSFLYQFDISNGLSAGNGGTTTSRPAATYVGSVLVQGLTVVQLTTGAAAGSVETIITKSDGKLQTDVGTPPITGFNLRRTSWRELVD